MHESSRTVDYSGLVQGPGFPVEERHGWTFIWMGRPEDANSAPVPEFHALLSDENWGDARGQLTVPCGYRLMLDNLLDLSHLTYVHGSTTGNDDVANQANVQLSSDHATHVRQTRIMEASQPRRHFATTGL